MLYLFLNESFAYFGGSVGAIYIIYLHDFTVINFLFYNCNISYLVLIREIKILFLMLKAVSLSPGSTLPPCDSALSATSHQHRNITGRVSRRFCV